MNSESQHVVAITAILERGGKFLIIKRLATEKRFPGKWTVPGGRLEVSDYKNLPKDTPDSWYNVLERCLRREVKEEVGLDIDRITYITSIAHIDAVGTPILVISCAAEALSGEVVLADADAFVWVTLEELPNYDFISGIAEEIKMASAIPLRTHPEWRRG